jgi:hypothetical protein
VSELATCAVIKWFGAKNLAYGCHHFSAEEKHRIERVCMGCGQFMPGLSRKERIQPLNALYFGPDTDLFG